MQLRYDEGMLERQSQGISFLSSLFLFILIILSILSKTITL